MSKLTKHIEKLTLLAGGSFETVHDRLRIAGRLSQYLHMLNIQEGASAGRVGSTANIATGTRDNSEHQFRLRFCRNRENITPEK